MVYRDISEQNQSAPFEYKYKVSLMDRFFSFLIDYLLLSPFVSFFLFLIFKDAIQYWRMNPTAPEQTSLTVLLAFCYVAFFSLIQATFIRVWRATPGQYFLKIRLIFEQSEGLLFWRAFCRQFGFWLSILFLGIPWLALLAHPQQKTFYDRIADCSVLSKKQSSYFLGFETESRYWRSFAATLILFVSMIVIAIVVGQYREVANRTESFKQRDKQNLFCAELKGLSQSSRLQMAIAMNLVGHLSDDCLDRESDFVLWKNKKDELGLAYYAKSLTEPDQEVEKKYLAQACVEQKKSMGCQISEAFLTGDFEKLYGYLKTQNSILANTLFYEFSSILNHPEDTSKGFSQLAYYDSARVMKKYILSEIIMRQSTSQRAPASEQSQQDLEKQALMLIEEL